MKTIVACFLGLAALAMSFAGGGSPVYADDLEAESSGLPILAPGAGTNGVQSLDTLHCVLYSDGADNCIVNVQLEAVSQQSSAVSEIDPSATESAQAVRFVDAIPVVVVQTVAIAAPGADAGDRKETPYARPMPVPPTEPALDLDAKATTGALLPPAGQSADAIVVAIVQSATVAAAGQSAGDNEETASAELPPAPKAPISILEAKTTARDNTQ